MDGVRTSGSTQTMPVDSSNTFYFDHPLDHIPGIMLLTEMLQAVRVTHEAAKGPLTAGRTRLDVQFPVMCESGTDVVLECVPDEVSSSWEVTARQSDITVSEARVTFTTEAGTGLDATAPRVNASLVHRQRVENVLLGPPRETAEASVVSHLVSPPPGHPLLANSPSVRSEEELIEAARQFCTLLSHHYQGEREDAQILWLSCTADLPRDLPREQPVSISWTPTTSRLRTVRYDLKLTDPVTDTEYGRIVNVSRCIDPATYRRLRSSQAG
ncbi:AfsA-related hotdog domain-containing protein [Streptomyces corynorhini]|uniref:A-factor biosynthesis hotdog domain-containing protein n=1 Tax=Streptomyces corynorhini TaxID=2282652 RepID=A0A370B120_9ACTN|nr:hypothetical protein DVH02_24535 [Streptomyces corynorhini]